VNGSERIAVFNRRLSAFTRAVLRNYLPRSLDREQEFLGAHVRAKKLVKSSSGSLGLAAMVIGLRSMIRKLFERKSSIYLTTSPPPIALAVAARSSVNSRNISWHPPRNQSTRPEIDSTVDRPREHRALLQCSEVYARFNELRIRY
jgi:hypothetical protein